jgi:photosystem II stability/assembly factor-like uncharacterized protein
MSRAPQSNRRPTADAAADAALAERIETDRRERQAAAPQGFAAQSRSSALVDVVAPGGSNRWRIIAGQRVESSSSAGNEWQPVTIPAAGGLTAGSAPSATVCWIVGLGGAVYITTDGTTFAALPFPEQVDLVSVIATDDRAAIVSAADGRSWRTTDRGVTWSPVR